MRFMVGTSSSPTCVTPNSSFIVSNVIYKNRNIPKYCHSRERGLNIFEKKGRAKNLPIGVAGPVRHGGDRGGGLILQIDPWLGFRRGAGGRVRMNEYVVCGYEYVLICSPKEHVAMGR
jgi:hypothetical protein